MADVMEHVEAAAAAASSSEVASRRQPPRHATFLIDDSRFSSADFLFIIFFLRGATSSLRAFPFIKFITEASLSSSFLFFFFSPRPTEIRPAHLVSVQQKQKPNVLSKEKLSFLCTLGLS